jgi:hypothetical protein
VLVALPQSPLVGLPVHGDEGLADLREDPYGGASAADVGSRTSVGADGAREEQTVADVGAGFLGSLEGWVVRRNANDPFDDGGPSPGPDQPDVGPHAEEQPQA